MGIHFFRCVHGNEHIRTHDEVHDTFAAIVRNVIFHVGENNSCASVKHIQLLLSTSQHWVHQRWYSHLIQC